MGSGGVTNRGVEKSFERRLDSTGKPNSRVDRYKNGKKVQSRWYDENGRAIRNRDYEHQNPLHDHTFPHDHAWNWNINPPRIPENLPPDYDNFN